MLSLLPNVMLMGYVPPIFCEISSIDLFLYECYEQTIPCLDSYRETSYTWPCISGKVTFPVFASKVAYTGQVTFYKVQEKHGYIFLVVLFRANLKEFFY